MKSYGVHHRAEPKGELIDDGVGVDKVKRSNAESTSPNWCDGLLMGGVPLCIYRHFRQITQ